MAKQKPRILDMDLFQNTVLFSRIIMKGPSRGEQKLNWQLAQKSWLSTSENVKSSRFVFHKDKQ